MVTAGVAGTAAAAAATTTARVAIEDYEHTSCAYTLSPATELGSCSILQLPTSSITTRYTLRLLADAAA
jgi:hypothetical protein